MISRRKYHQQISEVTATAVAEGWDVFNTCERISGFIAYRQIALRHCAADKWAGSFFFHDYSLLAVIQGIDLTVSHGNFLQSISVAVRETFSLPDQDRFVAEHGSKARFGSAGSTLPLRIGKRCFPVQIK